MVEVERSARQSSNAAAVSPVRAEQMLISLMMAATGKKEKRAAQKEMCNKALAKPRLRTVSLTVRAEQTRAPTRNAMERCARAKRGHGVFAVATQAHTKRTPMVR